jgi:uncharacterized protein
MLYDQAGIVIALLEATQICRCEKYAEWVLETLEYVQRDLGGKGDCAGAFFAAEDADSEGVEGKFYTWTLPQLEEVLGKEKALLFARVYNVSTQPGAEPSTLRLTAPVPSTIIDTMRECREALLAARDKRVRPHRDENVLADWNSFMAVALARAARVLRMPRIADRATACMKFVTNRMRDPSNGHLFHHFNVRLLPTLCNTPFSDDFFSLHNNTRKGLPQWRVTLMTTLSRFGLYASSTCQLSTRSCSRPPARSLGS